jgi:hypothetical protein
MTDHLVTRVRALAAKSYVVEHRDTRIRAVVAKSYVVAHQVTRIRVIVAKTITQGGPPAPTAGPVFVISQV